MTADEFIRSAVTLIVGVGGGAGVKALIDSLLSVRAGVSAKVGKRRTDIVQQRDEALNREQAALVREQAADGRADAEAKQRRDAEERAFRMRLRLLNAGIDPDEDVVFAKTIQKEPKEQ